MTNRMTSRERVLAALSHQQPDRVPMDLGASIVSSIHVQAYDNLKKYLGLDLGATKIFARTPQLAVVDPVILDLFGVDTLGVKPGSPENHPHREVPDEHGFIDEWGILRKMPPDADAYYVANAPLEGDISIHDVLNYPMPDPADPGYTRGLRARILALREMDQRAIVLSLPDSVVQQSQLLRGFSEWYTDAASNPDLLGALMDRILETQIAIWDTILSAVGDVIDVVFNFDDLAMQDRLIVSPAMYRQFLEPRVRKYIEFLKRKTRAKIVFHTDGAIVPVLPSLADMGVDCVNPLQVSAKGMGDVVALKKQFGDRLAFWGGVDSQHTLPHGAPDQVRAETASRIRDLNRDGGYVLGAVHNIQADVPAENIVALFETGVGK
jgi:uroporphyrinogen decarboxylase